MRRDEALVTIAVFRTALKTSLAREALDAMAFRPWQPVVEVVIFMTNSATQNPNLAVVNEDNRKTKRRRQRP